MKGPAALVISLLLLGVGACGSGSTPSASSSSSSSSSARTAASPLPSPAISSDWIEYHRDASRAGVGPAEPALGKPVLAWKMALDADVYASPLIVAGHVITATENDTVYSLDLFTGAVIWKTHLGSPVDASTLPCGDIGPVTGITGTPAVDQGGGRLYVVAYLQGRHHVLFALSLVDGSVVFQQDVDPQGSTPAVQQQRGALAIGSGRVYVPLGGMYGDCGPYHGYVVAVPLGSGPATVYQVPSSRGAGIWTAAGPAIDAAGDVFVVTGNGASRSAFDSSNSIIELTPDLAVRSYFAPADWIQLNATDTDLGALGPTLVGDAVLAVGKDGVAYLARSGQLGGVGGEIAHRQLCSGAFGGTAQDRGVVFVPCTDGLYALSIGPNGMNVLWRDPRPANASPIVSAGVVWAIEAGSGTLYALDEQTGGVLYSIDLGGAVHFSTPAATDGFVVAPAGHSVAALSVVG